jgi:hypothetical protein
MQSNDENIIRIFFNVSFDVHYYPAKNKFKLHLCVEKNEKNQMKG